MPGMKVFAFFAFIFFIGTIIGGVSEGTSGLSITVLSGDVNAVVDIIPVDSTEGFPGATHPESQRHIVIGKEVIQYTAITEDPDSFTGATRGVEHPRNSRDSDAAAHSKDDSVMNASASAINNVMGVLRAGSSSIIGTIWSLIWSDTFWLALWQMLMWDYAFLGGQLSILRILLIVVFTGGFLFGLVMASLGLARGLFVR